MSQAGSSGQPRVCLKACLIVVHTGPISLTTTPQGKQQGLSTKARGRNTPSQHVPQPLTDARTQLWPSLVGLAPHHTTRHHKAPTRHRRAARRGQTPHHTGLKRTYTTTHLLQPPHTCFKPSSTTKRHDSTLSIVSAQSQYFWRP